MELQYIQQIEYRKGTRLLLKHGILGLLNYGSMTGYEIDTAFRDSLHYFWEAQTSQIYRELQTLKRNGWATDKVVEQSGRPDKKVFSITDSGREELTRWLLDDNIDFRLRSSLLMKTFFRGERSIDENIAYFSQLEETIAGFQGRFQSQPPQVQRYMRLIDDPMKALYWKMTVEYGAMYMQMMIDWAEKCKKELEDIKYESSTDQRQPQGDEE